MQNLKQVITQQKWEYKIDNLSQQLTSNATLWEQLQESEKREKILKMELEKSQYEIAMQGKIVDRLKDELLQINREKQRLLQFKNSKASRLETLEEKAKEFEILENVDLSKLLSLIERKENKIRSLEASDLKN